MPNGNWRVIGIVLQKGLLDLFNMPSTEVQTEARSKGCQPFKLLALGNAGSTTSSAQDNGLNNAWNGEFPLECGSRGLISAHPGHHLHRDALIVKGADLLVDGAVESWIAIVQPDDAKAAPVPLDEKRKDLFQRQMTGPDPFTIGWNEFCDCWADEGVGPDQAIGMPESISCTQGQKIRSSGASSNEANRAVQRTPAGSGRSW